MSTIMWNDDYSVGAESLDNDHIILFSLINYLNDARLAGQDTKIIGTLLTSLIRYAMGHFEREEEMMEQGGYDEEAFRQHKEEHEQFAKQILEVKAKFDEQGPEGLGDDLGAFLSSWLVDHILDIDQQYKSCLKVTKD